MGVHAADLTQPEHSELLSSITQVNCYEHTEQLEESPSIAPKTFRPGSDQAEFQNFGKSWHTRKKHCTCGLGD